jgi:uncharacterized damage-inducible protein DinB
MPQGPVAPFIAELEQEAVATRRLFERIPADRLGWRPHAKSYTLGQLALHVARLPGIVTGLLVGEEVDATTVDFAARQPASVSEIRRTLEDALSGAREALLRWSAQDLATTWRLVHGPKVLMAAPKGALLRSLVCNHLYHHRGQLTVYLRLLDVPLPSIYGPSADEQVFGQAPAPADAASPGR